MGCAASSSLEVTEVAEVKSSTHVISFPLSDNESPKRVINSASKDSVHSSDSGFADKGSTEVRQHITEDSSEQLRKTVEDSFHEDSELDLSLTGKPCEQRLSAKERNRKEEQKIANLLLNEGLVQRPISRVGRSVRFDIVQAPLNSSLSPSHGHDSGHAPNRLVPLNVGTSGFKRPARLEKLILPSRLMNKEDIDEKIERANTRRLEIQQERITSIQKTTGFLDAFAKRHSSTISPE